jgi:hypothetical protein
MTAYEIHDGQTSTEASFPVICSISPAKHQSTIAPYIHLSLTTEMCESPDQAAHYHTLGFKVRSFISDLALSWLQWKKLF